MEFLSLPAEFDILKLAGVANAIAIQRAGHRATILEQASGANEVGDGLHKIRPDYSIRLTSTQVGAGIQLPSNCTRILNKWAILSTIELYATRPSNVILRGYKDGGTLFRKHTPAPVPCIFEPPHLFLYRAEFLRILVEEAVRLGVAFRFNAAVTKIDFEKAKILLSDGKEYGYDVIFGTNGSKSVCRELAFGESLGPQLSGDGGCVLDCRILFHSLPDSLRLKREAYQGSKLKI